MKKRSAAGLALFLWCLEVAAADLPPFELSDDVTPRKHSIELTIDPDSDAFQGQARIDVELRKPLNVIWLNAADLTISEAGVEIAGKTSPAKALLAGGEFLGLELDSPARGRAVLVVRFEGRLADKARIGAYRLQYENAWYVFTTFTPIGARSVFPCFDHPRFKTPWELSIRVPRNHDAYANSGAARQANEPGGMKLVAFAPTQPLPSEVVAFAVGPFEALEGKPAGRRRIPVRVIAPRGHGAEGEDAARITPDVLDKLEAYAGMPYPWDKLDHIALPQNPFGATENPGLITYLMRRLLYPPGQTTDVQLQALRSIQTHELAHQWFGNLVTQAGWEDVWLSEGFATWMEWKIRDESQPAARKMLHAAAARERMMRTDAGPKTRPVRVAMRDREALKDVYSSFVYVKGAAIALMLERWIGEERFRNGLRQYLNRHRLGSATSADLAQALQSASGLDVAPVLWDFLDRSGVPVVRAAPRCDGGARTRIAFEQVNAAGRWRAPVCWKTENAGGCAVVDAAREVELPDGSGCPAWIYTNAGAAGYYRTEWNAGQLAALSAKGLALLTAAERVTLANDLGAQRVAGRLDEAAAKPVLEKLASDAEPEVARAAREALSGSR